MTCDRSLFPLHYHEGVHLVFSQVHTICALYLDLTNYCSRIAYRFFYLLAMKHIIEYSKPKDPVNKPKKQISPPFSPSPPLPGYDMGQLYTVGESW